MAPSSHPGHELRGQGDRPVGAEHVRATSRGYRRSSGLAAKQVSVPTWHMTTYVLRWLQPATPTVYSTRSNPPTHGPCTAGWMKSLDKTVAVAEGQLRSKRPRCRAGWTAP